MVDVEVSYIGRIGISLQYWYIAALSSTPDRRAERSMLLDCSWQLPISTRWPKVTTIEP